MARERDDDTINGLDVLDATRAWAIAGTMTTLAGGGQESIAETDVQLLHTTDGGAHWTTVRDERSSDYKHSVPSPGAQWVTVGPSGALYVSGFSTNVDRSTDGGHSWTTLNIPFPSGGELDTDKFCWLTDSGSSLVAGIREVVNNSPQAFYEVSSDGGSTWRMTTPPPSASDRQLC